MPEQHFGPLRWHNLIDHARCLFYDYILLAHDIALIHSYFTQRYYKAATKDMIAFVLAKLQHTSVKAAAQVLVSRSIALPPSNKQYKN